MHDTEPHTWRHMNFFQHEAYLTARLPRVICPEHGVKQVQVPWARERSDFTLLFEALVMALAKEMPVKALAGLVDEEDKRMWRIDARGSPVIYAAWAVGCPWWMASWQGWQTTKVVVHHYVDQAVEAQDLSETEQVGIDDTSFRRGQDYVTVFCDLDVEQRRAVFVTEGRDQQTVEQLAGFL